MAICYLTKHMGYKVHLVL